jgi:hypothetical protein
VTKAVAARETRWRINKKSLIKLWAYWKSPPPQEERSRFEIVRINLAIYCSQGRRTLFNSTHTIFYMYSSNTNMSTSQVTGLPRHGRFVVCGYLKTPFFHGFLSTWSPSGIACIMYYNVLYCTVVFVLYAWTVSNFVFVGFLWLSE